MHFTSRPFWNSLPHHPSSLITTRPHRILSPMLRDRLLWVVARACLHNTSISPHRSPCPHHKLLGEGLIGSYSSHSAGASPSSSQQWYQGWLTRAVLFGRQKISGRSCVVAVVATGFLGAGLYVVLADAGTDGNSKEVEAPQSTADPPKKRVVVLGSGWGGMSFVKNLDCRELDVRVVSPRNYFVFTPLLPSVTSGTVGAASIIEPFRKIIGKKHDVQFYETECVKIDVENKQVICEDVTEVKPKGKEKFSLEYDYLVIAVGALPNTFGTPGVEKYCRFLKDIEDAQRIHQNVVDCFESASLPNLSDDDRRKLLSFVIVGGGPTGVEVSAELHDLIHEDLLKLYPHLDDKVSIMLLQSGDHILNTFDARISEYAEEKFARDGVCVKTGCRVLEVTDDEICFKSKLTKDFKKVQYGMVVWSTGIGTRPVVADLMKQIGQVDRRVLATDEWLRVKNCDCVYALGDCATIEHRKIIEDINYIFKLADKDSSGTLSAEEFVATIELLRQRYPQIDLYMDHQHLKGVIDLLDDAMKAGRQGSVQLDIEHLTQSLCKVDSQMKSTPATAQVAAQQGEYLAKCFNNLECQPKGPLRVRGEGRHQFPPFKYRHFGQFAPLGGEKAAAELPGDWVSIGRSTQWLWYSVYASKQMSWRTRAMVMFDWTKHFVFGRDVSRI